MKRELWLIGVLLLSVPYLSAMSLIEKLCEWRDEKRADQFIRDFGSKTLRNAHQEVWSLSSGGCKKLFEKDIQKKSPLHTGALVLALLPYDMQKEVLERVDPIFIDHQTTKYFLNVVPIQDILRRYAMVDRKISKNNSYIFPERMLFGKAFSYEITKSQMLRLSITEGFLLEHLKDGSDNKILASSSLLVSSSKSFLSKKQLIGLQHLLKNGYISFPEKEYTVNVRVDYTRFKLMQAFFLNVFLPWFTNRCAQNVLLSVDPDINAKMKKANQALERLESLGKGPFLKHTLEEYICSPGSIFKCFLSKFWALPTVLCSKLVFLLTIESLDRNVTSVDVGNMLYPLIAPGIICCMYLGTACASLFRDVKMSEFKNVVFVEIAFCFLGQAFGNLLNQLFEKDEDSAMRTIKIAQIPSYINSYGILGYVL